MKTDFIRLTVVVGTTEKTCLFNLRHIERIAEMESKSYCMVSMSGRREGIRVRDTFAEILTKIRDAI